MVISIYFSDLCQTCPAVTLEQWRALVAVVDAGGYAQAAEALHKSQSAVTYAVQKLESQLGVKAFEIEGRKAVLTPTGALLYRRARALLDEAGSAERAARALSAGWEAQIRLAVEILFPTWLLLQCLDRFGAESPQHPDRADRIGAGRHRRGAAAGAGRPRHRAAGAAGLSGRSADAHSRDPGRASGASAARS